MAGKTYFVHDNTNVFKRPTFGRHNDTNLTKANASVPKKTPVEHSIGEEKKRSFTFYLGESYSACGKEILFLTQFYYLALNFMYFNCVIMSLKGLAVDMKKDEFQPLPTRV